MALRKLPELQAFQAPCEIEFDVPPEARQRWPAVQAAQDADRTLAIDQEIGERWDGSGITLSYVRGFLRRVGAGPVTINLNSGGGDYFTGLAIYNAFREHEGEVTVNVLGIAASAASVIAFASDKLRVPKAGFLMIHKAWAMLVGNADEVRDAASLLDKFDGAMAGVYADRSGISREKIMQYMAAETFFSGEEAVSLGLADELLSSDQIKPGKEPEARAAMRDADLAMARTGVPRLERRALLAALTRGTPRAAPGAATPRAGDLELLAGLQALVENINA